MSSTPESPKSYDNDPSEPLRQEVARLYRLSASIDAQVRRLNLPIEVLTPTPDRKYSLDFFTDDENTAFSVIVYPNDDPSSSEMVIEDYPVSSIHLSDHNDTGRFSRDHTLGAPFYRLGFLTHEDLENDVIDYEYGIGVNGEYLKSRSKVYSSGQEQYFTEPTFIDLEMIGVALTIIRQAAFSFERQ